MLAYVAGTMDSVLIRGGVPISRVRIREVPLYDSGGTVVEPLWLVTVGQRLILYSISMDILKV